MARMPNPHPPGCFWHDFTEKVGTPNLKWCEPTICSVISEPANTWSNLGYMVVSVWFWWVYRKVKSATIRAFAPAAFAMGFFSFVYHASNNYLSQLFDFVGMFLYVFVLIVINLRRVGWVTRERQQLVYWALVLGTTALTHVLYVVDLPYQFLIAIAVLVIVTTEVMCYRAGDGKRYRYLWFVISLVLIVVAEGFSLLDLSRTWCQPENLILHGHAIWHVGGAISIFFAFQHYRQIELD